MSDNHEDMIFFERLQSGEIKAIEELYVRYRRWLLLVVVSVLGDKAEQDAPDIVQDFFLYFWEKKKYESLKSPYAIDRFLYRSIYNKCMDVAKQKKYYNSVDWDELESLEHYFEHPADRVEQHELHAQLTRALKKLPAGSAEVLRLAYIEEKSRAEVAAEMHISPHTVRNQLAKAVKILKGCFQNFNLLL